MSSLVLAALAGGISGALAATLVVAWLAQRSGLPAAQAPQATDVAPTSDTPTVVQDPATDPLAAEFSQHARAVREQVSRYADLLADGDAVLRARLRRFEDGVS